MNYLTSAIRFALKNWMLVLPSFILCAIVSLITRGMSTARSGIAGFGSIADPGAVLTAISSMLGMGVLIFILSILANLIYGPATYGMINKGLETGSTGLNEIGAAIGNHFVKYVIYIVGMIVVYFAAALAIMILGLVLSLLGGLGQFLAALASLVGMICLFVLLSLWFPAMLVDGLDLMAAAKKSIEVAKSCFWTILGISLLIGIAFGITGLILGFIARIPFIGPIVYAVVPSGLFFLTAILYLMIYRERTGRMTAE